MALNARNYSDEEIEDVRSKKDPNRVMRDRMRAERPESPLRQKRDNEKEQGQRAELDVLKVLKQVRSGNPYLSQNNLLEKRIGELEDAVNPQEQAKIKQDISNILSTTYTNVIKDKSHELYFRKHASEWGSQIKTMKIEEQLKWIENIDKETEKRKAPFDALKQSLDKVEGLSGSQKETIYKDFSEYMANHSRHENEKYAQTFQNNVDQFNNLLGQVSGLTPEEKAKRAKDFLNVSSTQQEAELKKLRELTETKDLDEKFKQFSPERQKQQPKFNTLSRKEKEAAIRELTKELTGEYRRTYEGSKDVLTKQDLELFEQTAKGGDIALLEMCLKDMPRVVKDAKQSYDAGEKLMKKFSDALGKEKAKQIFDSVGWYGSQITSFDRKKIIESKTLDKIFAGNELATREQNIKTFDRNLEMTYADKKRGHGHSLMHKKGREANKAWFKKLATKDQSSYLKKGSDIERSLKKREKINKTHATLPAGVQREMYNVFENVGMEERENLNKKIAWQRGENLKKYRQQLQAAGQQDLIPKDPKALKVLEDEFNNLSLKEQSERKENDKAIFNPELQAAVKNFKQAFARVTPTETFMQAWQDFQKLPQPHERVAFIKQFLLEHDQEGNEALNKEIDALKEADGKDLQSNEFREKVVSKTADEAEEELENGNNTEAAELYKEASDMDPERDDLRIIAEVLEESAYKDAPIPPSVLEQTEEDFDTLMQSDESQKTLKDLLVAQKALESLSQSERAHQNLAEAEDKSMDALKKSGNQDAVELQEAVSDYEDEKGLEDKTVITSDDGKLEAEEVMTVKLDMNQNDLSKTDSESKSKRKAVVQELKANQGKNKGMETFSVTDEQGRTQKADEAENKHEQMMDEQKAAVTDALIANLVANKVPRPIAEKAAKQIVANRFDKEMNKFTFDELEN